jgi:hypothetical protein
VNVSSLPFSVVISALSPDGTIATAPGGSVVTVDGKWTFGTATATGGNALLLNGAQAAGGFGHEYHVLNGGKLYTFTANKFWYLWSGSWTQVAAPI